VISRNAHTHTHTHTPSRALQSYRKATAKLPQGWQSYRKAGKATARLAKLPQSWQSYRKAGKATARLAKLPQGIYTAYINNAQHLTNQTHHATLKQHPSFMQGDLFINT
jgi:hypothetical protein